MRSRVTTGAAPTKPSRALVTPTSPGMAAPVIRMATRRPAAWPADPRSRRRPGRRPRRPPAHRAAGPLTRRRADPVLAQDPGSATTARRGPDLGSVDRPRNPVQRQPEQQTIGWRARASYRSSDQGCPCPIRRDGRWVTSRRARDPSGSRRPSGRSGRRPPRWHRRPSRRRGVRLVATTPGGRVPARRPPAAGDEACKAGTSRESSASMSTLTPSVPV